MPADRFFHDGPLQQGATIELTGPEHHHLARVMRISIGEEIELINGRGALAHATLQDLNKRSAACHLLKVATIHRPAAQTILAIPLMRPSKLELIVEKGTELGADAFHFYPADHSEKPSLSENGLERLQNLILSAVKQSGRLFLPSIELLPNLEHILKASGSHFYGDVNPDAATLASIETGKETIFITGPERGFSDREEKLLKEKAQGVKLNHNILRAETAPLAAIAILKR